MKTQNNRNEDLARANPSMARPVLFVLALAGSAVAALMWAGLALTAPQAAIPPPSVLIIPGGNVYGLGERIVVYYDSRDPIIDEAGRGNGTYYLGDYTYNNETTRVGSFVE
ncbi:MAG: hypothetical protein V3R73_00480, partial [Sphingomonadales bacterium]